MKIMSRREFWTMFHRLRGKKVSTLEFTVNGCSAVPDFDIGPCCNAHDIAYTRGGLLWCKIVADLQLLRCLWNHKQRRIACLYWFGVSVFGWLFFDWRWRQLDPPTCDELKDIEVWFQAQGAHHESQGL